MTASGSKEAIRIVGVVGAGQMGNGIAHVAALSGLEVVLTDLRAEALTQALATIGKNLDRQVQKGAVTEADRMAALGRIRTTAETSALGPCDIVIEAATEREEIKTTILKGLIPHLKPDAIIATNTSSISITRLAAVTDRPHQVIGMHFMNPVPVMKLVEVIRGIATDDATFGAVQQLAERMGKIVALAEDYPAFIVNRILVPMINEAAFALMEGVGSVAAIDTAMKLGTNQPMGPLELGDFIGLDTCLAIMRVLQGGMGDSKYRPCPLLVKYVEAGWLGRKTKRGFYDYRGETPLATR
ncbi:3-hydroxybutyryl-CoA dehydrogenase [Acidisoma cellulosilytica]|uniref:3-hydroxybutyryl-CoA dehydrogenase n=1 Tax=Acidisoma cellulosilyticum TaxID=2802395 RepID=A0A963Z305_9PROT|nr:3-hydroxybutyryl-CoA dehydrogenase [Acidisoma cellulosilyticum]MCB8880868.1 3-hydroxybutyryl-CoA dehydrogenase [Acidisoma cellulosilyticum]